MKNAHVTSLLSDYLEGGMSPADHEHVKSHLIFCNACRRHLAELEKNQLLLQSTPKVQMPAGLAERVIGKATAELRQPSAAPAPRREREPFSWTWTIRGLAFGMASVAAFLVVRHWPEHAQKTEQVVVEKKASKVAPAEPNGSIIEKPKLAAPNELKSERRAAPIPPAAPKAEAPALAAKAPGAPAMAKRLDAEDRAAPAAAAQGFSAGTENQMQPSRSQIMKKAVAAPAAKSANVPSPASAPLAAPAPGSSEFTELSGRSSGITGVVEKVISNEGQWKDLWARHTSHQHPAPELPFVDFKTNDVLAVFAGQRNSGGFSVRIVSIESTQWEGRPARRVLYHVDAPPKGAMATANLTQPYVLKTVPKFKGRTFFQESR